MKNSILVVDDEQSILKLLKLALEAPGRDIRLASTVEAAKKEIEQQEFDLLIVDKNLPDGTGFDVILHSRELKHESETIVITAYSDTDSAIQALTLDVYRYVRKPFEIKHFKIDVHNALDARRLKKELALRTEELEKTNQKLTATLDKVYETERRLRQSERLANIGYLAAGVAHEINNPLSMLSMAVPYTLRDIQSLLHSLHTDTQKAEIKKRLEKIVGSLDTVQEAVDFLMRLSSDLYSLGQTEIETPVPVRVADAVRSAVRITRHQLKHKAKVVVDVDESIYIRGQSSRLVQVLINLLTNAAKAIPGENPDGNCVTIRGKAEDDQVTIYLSDTGVGIAEDNLGQIFDPFFSIAVEDQEPGSGIGLTLVRDIVEDYGGSITVASEMGLGTRFTIRLPKTATAEFPISAASDDAREESLHARYHILFFDSEEVNLTEYKKAFGAMHEVYLTSTVKELETAIREKHHLLDVIVCELPLPPNLEGVDIGDFIEQWPGLSDRFIFIGKSSKSLDEAENHGFTVFERPVRLAILLGAIYDLGPRKQPS